LTARWRALPGRPALCPARRRAAHHLYAVRLHKAHSDSLRAQRNPLQLLFGRNMFMLKVRRGGGSGQQLDGVQGECAGWVGWGGGVGGGAGPGQAPTTLRHSSRAKLLAVAGCWERRVCVAPQLSPCPARGRPLADCHARVWGRR
jgi:hypothetical protein